MKQSFRSQMLALLLFLANSNYFRTLTDIFLKICFRRGPKFDKLRFAKVFKKVSKLLNILSFLSTSRKESVGELVVWWQTEDCNKVIDFKIFGVAISKHCRKNICDSNILGCKLYSPMFQSKSDTTRGNSMKCLQRKLSPQKSLQWIPILVGNYNISKNRLVNRHCCSD